MSFPSRDLRDPKALGEALLKLTGKMSIPSEVYDDLSLSFEDGSIPDYDGSGDIKTATPSGAEH